jgi:hypothetical protein
MSAPTNETNRIVAGELAAVRGELIRVDGKCATLAGLAVAALAFVLTQASVRTPLVERVLLVTAAVALAAAALVLLLRVLRPAFGPTGFCRWAGMSPAEIQAELADVAEDFHQAAEVAVLSRLADRKFRALRTAIHLLVVAVVLIAAAILAGVIA